MRKKRFKEIQRILTQDDITGQDILISKLQEVGINITQATLSRDLAYLKVGKVYVQNKGYIYVLPKDLKRLEDKSYPAEDNITGAISIAFSRNIAVIHTLPGYATPICVSLDRAKINEIIGTIAGDDTIIIVIDERVSQETLTKILLNHYPELKEII